MFHELPSRTRGSGNADNSRYLTNLPSHGAAFLFGKLMNIEVVWSTLETTLRIMESGFGDWNNHLETTRACVSLIMDYPANEIVEQVKNSNFPTLGTLRWLAHEAGQLDVKDDNLRELNTILNQWSGQDE